MALVNMRDMLQHAYQHGYAVGAFDLVSLEFLEGIMAAAERCQAPVILSLAESRFEYPDFELVMPAVEAAARRATVPGGYPPAPWREHGIRAAGINWLQRNDDD